MISSVPPTRSSTFYAYLITKIGNRNLNLHNLNRCARDKKINLPIILQSVELIKLIFFFLFLCHKLCVCTVQNIFENTQEMFCRTLGGCRGQFQNFSNMKPKKFLTKFHIITPENRRLTGQKDIRYQLERQVLFKFNFSSRGSFTLNDSSRLF